MAIQYYLSGQAISGKDAARFLTSAAQNAGHDMADIQAYWLARGESEEARDFLFDLSGYSLEIIVDDDY